MHLYSVYTPYILRPHSVRTFPPVTKKNPTSQCAQLDQFQAHKSTLAGRISYFSGIWVYLHSWGCAYQDAYVLGRGIHYRGCTFIAGGVHTRTHMYWGRGINYRGCTFIAGVVHTRMHVYWGRGINYRRCTFIAGGVHTRTHILPQLVKSI